jgi:hypothetical protein
MGRRDRCAIVKPIAQGRVTLRAPAGGYAVFAPLQVGALRGALRTAATESTCPTEPHGQLRAAVVMQAITA